MVFDAHVMPLLQQMSWFILFIIIYISLYFVIGINSNSLSPALLPTISNTWSAHAPPTVLTNVNLTPPSVFSHPLPPPCHRRLLLHPEFSLGLLLFLPSSLFVGAVHEYFCHSLTRLCACVYAYFSNHMTYLAIGLDQPHTLLGHTVIFHSHQLMPALAHTHHPARSCPTASLAHVKPFWILPTHCSV